MVAESIGAGLKVAFWCRDVKIYEEIERFEEKNLL